MDHCRKAVLGGVGNSQRELRLARFVERLGDLLLEALRPLGVEIDRRDREPAAAERHRAGPRLAELDARLLERDEVLERVGDRAEAVLELLAQSAELGDFAGARDAPVDVDLRLLVGDVVGRHVGVDVDVEAHGLRLVMSREALALARPDRLVEHAHVQLEAERRDVARLLVAEQGAGAADLEVPHRDLEAGAELGVVAERAQALRRLLGERGRARVQEVRVSALARAADTPADLVELGEAEEVGALDDQRVRLRDVDARLDDARRDEHVGLAAQEAHHPLLELLLLELPVRDLERHVRAQAAQALGRLVDRLHAVVHEERLALALLLADERLLDEVLVVLADVGLHGAAALGRRLDDADVAHAGEGHLQRARDRRGAHRDDVDLELELSEQLLLLDAEALLLVDDDQADVLAAQVAAEEPVRADEDVDRARVERGDRLALLLGRAEAADVLDREGVVLEALGERAEVLLGENRGRREDEDLLAVVGRLERGAQRDLRLAVADVAADEAVNRLRALHVALDLLDRLALVGRLLPGERGLELAQPVGVLGEGVAVAAAALGVEVEQLARELLRGAARARLHRLPRLAAELAQRRVAAAGADVAADLRELVDRHEDAVGAGELQLEVVARDAADGLRLAAGELGEAVVLVDDDVAGPEVRERPERASLAGARPRSFRALAAKQPVLGDDRQAQAGGDDPVPEVRLREVELRPSGAVAVDPVRAQAREVVGGALAVALARPGHDGLVVGAHELLELGLGLLEGSRSEVGGLGAELDRLILRDRAEADLGSVVERLGDVVGLDVEVVRVRVVEGGADVLPVVGEGGADLLVGGDDEGGVAGREVEERLEAVDGEELGDVGPRVRVLERGDLGHLAVLGGELGGRRDLDLVRVAQAALREGGEPAERLDLDVEHVDADRAVLGGGVDVEQPAADGELAAVLDLVDALVAGADEVGADFVEVEQLAFSQREAVGAELGVRDLLAQGDRGDDDDGRLAVRVVAGARVVGEQRVERRDAEADEVRRRREVRLVRDAAARVEAHGARGEPVAQVGGEVARLAGGAGGAERGPAARQGVVDAVEKAGDQVRAQARGDERAAAVLGERDAVGTRCELSEEGSQGHAGMRSDRACGSRGRAARDCSARVASAFRAAATSSATSRDRLSSWRSVRRSVR